MKPYSSPFSVFSLIFTESADNLQKWNHFSRLFLWFHFYINTFKFIFRPLNLSLHIFWNHILRLFLQLCGFMEKNFKLWNHFSRLFYCFICIRIVFAKMTPYSSPFSAFSIVFTISWLKTCLKTRSPFSQNLKMTPYSSPFPTFASVFFAQNGHFFKWSHISRLF